MRAHFTHVICALSVVAFVGSQAAQGLDIYYTDRDAGAVYHNGSPLIMGRNAPRGITVSSEKIYWTEPSSGAIYQANLDGTNITQVASGNTWFPLDVSIDGGCLYWTDRSDETHNGFLKQLDLSSGVVTTLYSYDGEFLFLPDGLDIQGDWAYVISYDSHQLDRYQIRNGTSKEHFATVLGPGDVAFSDESRVYYTDWYGDAIWSRLLDGSDLQNPLSGMGNRWGIDVVGDSLFWAESHVDANPGIYRSNLDGSGATLLYSGGTPIGLVVIPEPATCLLICMAGFVATRRKK